MSKHLPLQLTPIARVMMARRFWWATPLVAPGLALANPTGGTVTSGGATISAPNTNTVQVTQTTGSASINWQTFSIANGEFVIFNQPSASAVVLNRVIGGSPSEILGNMIANGRVFLINPAGVLFAPGSHIDVGALVASTMNMSDADFKAGRYVFTANGSTASVVNAGTITTAAGGFVVLAADTVSNTGVVQAQLGQVVLASGSAMTLNIGDSGLIGYQIDKAALSDHAGVTNAGQLLADGGRVVMAAQVERSLLATVVNNTGLVQARSIAQGANGEIILAGEGGDVVNAGTLDASGANGQNGGSIHVVGDHATKLATTSVINTAGDGLATTGGFVEVSGHTVGIRGALNIGKGGTFLLDPALVTVADGSGSSNGNSASGTVFENTIESLLRSGTNVDIVASNKIVVSNLTDNLLDGRGTGSIAGGNLLMGIGTVAGACNAGGVCTSGTFSRGPGQLNGGTITFLDKNDGIAVDGNLDLIAGSQYGGIDSGPLQSAHGNINLDGRTVTVTNPSTSAFSDALQAAGNITVNAFGDIVINGDVWATGFGATPAVHLVSGTGKVTAGDIAVGTSSNFSTGLLSIHAYSDITTGSLDVHGAGSASGSDGAAAKLLSDHGAITINGPITVDANGRDALLDLEAYANITVNGSVSLQGSDFSYAAAEASVVSHNGTVTMQDIVVGTSSREGYGSLTVTGKGNVTLGSIYVTGSTNALAHLTAQTGTLTVDNVFAMAPFGSTGSAVLSGGAGVTLTGTSIQSGNIVINGDVTANANPYLQLIAHNDLTVNGDVTLNMRSASFLAGHSSGSGNLSVHSITLTGDGTNTAFLRLAARGDGITTGNITQTGTTDVITVANTSVPSALSASADGNIALNAIDVSGGGGTHNVIFPGMPVMAHVQLTSQLGSINVRKIDVVGVPHHHNFTSYGGDYGSSDKGLARLDVNALNGSVSLGSYGGHVRVEGYGSSFSNAGAEFQVDAGNTITVNAVSVIAHAGDEFQFVSGGFSNSSYANSFHSHAGSAEMYLRAGGNIVINGPLTETADGHLVLKLISHNGSVAVNGPVNLTANAGSSDSVHHSQFTSSGSVAHSQTTDTSSHTVNGTVDVDLDGYSGVTVAQGITVNAHGDLNVRMMSGCGSPFGTFCSGSFGPGAITVNGPLDLTNAGGTFTHTLTSSGTNGGVAFQQSNSRSLTGGDEEVFFYGGGGVTIQGDITAQTPGAGSVEIKAGTGNIAVNGNITVLSKGGHGSAQSTSGGVVINTTPSTPVGEASLWVQADNGAVTAGNIDVRGNGHASVRVTGQTVAIGGVTVIAGPGVPFFSSIGGTIGAIDGHFPRTIIGPTGLAELFINQASTPADVGTSSSPANVLVEGDGVLVGGSFRVHGNLLVHANNYISSSSQNALDAYADGASFAVKGGSDSYGAYGSINLANSTLHIGTGQVQLGHDDLANLVLQVFTQAGNPASAAPNLAFSAADVSIGNLDLAGDHVYIQANQVNYNGTVTQAQHDLFVFYDTFTPDADIHVDQVAQGFSGANFGVPGPYPGTTFVIGSTLTFSDVFIGDGGPLTMPNGENFVFLTNGHAFGLDQISTSGFVTFTQPLADLAALSYNPLITQFVPTDNPNNDDEHRRADDSGTPTGAPGETEAGDTQQQTSSGLQCQ